MTRALITKLTSIVFQYNRLNPQLIGQWNIDFNPANFSQQIWTDISCWNGGRYTVVLPSQQPSTDMNRYWLLEWRKIYFRPCTPIFSFLSLFLPSPPLIPPFFWFPCSTPVSPVTPCQPHFHLLMGTPCRHQLIPVVVVFLLRFHLVAIYLILWNKFLLTICTCSDIWQPNMGFNMPSNRHILQNATHTDLVSSGNAVFHKICVTNIKLEAELKGLRYIH